MKKILLIVLLFAYSTVITRSQTCSVAALKTQAEVDNFSTTYPGCKVISSNLQITSPEITNLDGLRGITRINLSLK
ncbi:hypothetical protein [Dyadobacter sandarakinus]|uniref:Uncharacterized protein n=1 Tax=Dyadobacter sandarakinus TaxID=2747268 RepID=A0ABX7I5T2_9BACT|nr:hypothetical protein [Dyadobacter sandarakinus]QRR01456.1 hypothetical protein HWI92_11350 [Dyadobacter sandarakinus]